MVFTHIERDRYADSLEILFAATVLNDQPGISRGYIGMAGEGFRETLREAGMDTFALGSASTSDLVLLAEAEGEEAFQSALQEALKAMTPVTSEDREPQMAPSQVFFGETRGASLCLPNRVPPKRAAVSQIQEEAQPRTRVCHQIRLTEMTIRMPKSTQG